MNTRRDRIIEFNLEEIIPFNVDISTDSNSLVLTKGIMKGEINLDSIILEIEQEIPNVVSVSIQESADAIVSLFIEFNDKIEAYNIELLILKIISTELPSTLVNQATHKPLIYIPNNYFGFPLIGSIYFGVIDRGTNLLQVRSITGCPLNCPFCSVDEGPASKTKIRDFMVDTDYLVDTYNYVVEKKKLSSVEAHLDGQGEPMSYPYLSELVNKLWLNPKTKVISLQTDGWFLDEKIIDELAEAKLTRINLSINAIDNLLAKKLAGRGDYNISDILSLAEYIVNSGISLLLAPIWLPGINDKEIEEIILFSKKINSKELAFPTLGIQNYLHHNDGRNMKNISQMKFRDFYEKLRSFETKYDVENLVLKEKMFEMYKTKFLPLPMKKDERVTAEVVFLGRLENEVIAKANNRIIHVSNIENASIGRKVKIRIIRNKHNIYFGVPV